MQTPPMDVKGASTCINSAVELDLTGAAAISVIGFAIRYSYEFWRALPTRRMEQLDYLERVRALSHYDREALRAVYADRAGGGEDARAPGASPGCARPEPTGPARSSVRP